MERPSYSHRSHAGSTTGDLAISGFSHLVELDGGGRQFGGLVIGVWGFEGFNRKIFLWYLVDYRQPAWRRWTWRRNATGVAQIQKRGSILVIFMSLFLNDPSSSYLHLSSFLPLKQKCGLAFSHEIFFGVFAHGSFFRLWRYCNRINMLLGNFGYDIEVIKHGQDGKWRCCIQGILFQLCKFNFNNLLLILSICEIWNCRFFHVT